MLNIKYFTKKGYKLRNGGGSCQYYFVLFFIDKVCVRIYENTEASSLWRLSQTGQQSASTLCRLPNLFTTLANMFHISAWRQLTSDPQWFSVYHWYDEKNKYNIHIQQVKRIMQNKLNQDDKGHKLLKSDDYGLLFHFRLAT